MPLTDFCNRSTARAPKKPPDSHTTKHLAVPCMQVEDAVDACLLALSEVGHLPKEKDHLAGIVSHRYPRYLRNTGAPNITL